MKTTADTAVQRRTEGIRMGCSILPDINTPLSCQICEKAPIYTEWQGKYRPEIHQLACFKCGKIVRGYSKQKAVERWNKMVLQDLWSYGERKDNE